MLEDMMSKLLEMQQKMESQKKVNANIIDEIKSSDSNIQISINANREIVDLKIQKEMLEDVEMLQDILISTINKAIQVADKRNEEQMAGVAKGMIPGLPF
jgi:DNA-binding protein YbaB